MLVLNSSCPLYSHSTVAKQRSEWKCLTRRRWRNSFWALWQPEEHLRPPRHSKVTKKSKQMTQLAEFNWRVLRDQLFICCVYLPMLFDGKIHLKFLVIYHRRSSMHKDSNEHHHHRSCLELWKYPRESH